MRCVSSPIYPDKFQFKLSPTFFPIKANTTESSFVSIERGITRTNPSVGPKCPRHYHWQYNCKRKYQVLKGKEYSLLRYKFGKGSGSHAEITNKRATQFSEFQTPHGE
jgi:hypothetical protein